MPWATAISEFGEERLKTLAGVRSTLSEWRTQGVPADVYLPLVLERSAGQSVSEPAASYEARPLHLTREFQRTHSFTMIVQAMWDLQKRFEAGEKAVWNHKLYPIWNLLQAIRPVVAEISGWKDEDWERLVGVDYWLRLTKRRETTIEEILHKEGPV